MRAALCLLAALALTACKTMPAIPPEPVIITKTVNVPVPTPCPVKLPPDAVLASQSADLSVDAYDLAKLALADRAQLRGALAEWQAAARACATPPG